MKEAQTEGGHVAASVVDKRGRHGVAHQTQVIEIWIQHFQSLYKRHEVDHIVMVKPGKGEENGEVDLVHFVLQREDIVAG